jgi:putative membrane protein
LNHNIETLWHFIAVAFLFFSYFQPMKYTTTFTLVVLTVCGLSACSSSRNADGTRKKKVTVLTPKTKTPGRGIVNAAGDGLTPGINSATTNGAGSRENAENIANQAILKATAGLRPSLQKTDSLTASSLIDRLTENETLILNWSKIAKDKSTVSKIKEYAVGVVADHQQFQKEIGALAAAKNLGKISGSISSSVVEPKGDFNLWYVQLMIERKRKQLSTLVTASRSKDEVIRNFAVKYLPVVRKQLDDAQDLTKVVSPK